MIGEEEHWRPLLQELAQWRDQGICAQFWWRDDDAVEVTPALERMIALGRQHRIPLGLAVIPARATNELACRLRLEEHVQVLHHGFLHLNHALPGERAAEFGSQRSAEIRLAEIAEGRQMLHSFDRVVPVFVPPWNRYSGEIVPGLLRLGIEAISVFGPSRQLSDAIVECNCHVDIISWRTTRGFAGVEKTVRKIVEQLEMRRQADGSRTEPLGILTHHLVHDEGCWHFLAELFARLDGNPAVRWIGPAEVLTEAKLI